SFLVVRSWMYHFFAAIACVAAFGIVVTVGGCWGRRFRRPSMNSQSAPRFDHLRQDILLLSGVYATFLLALAYHAVRAFQTAGFAGALGYYLFAIVTAEVILALIGLEAVAPASVSRVIAPAGIVCFAAVEFFGMTFYSIPYYTGLIGHLPNGN